MTNTMIEKDLFVKFIDELEKRGFSERIHLPNSAFNRHKNDALKYLPDLIFPAKEKIFMIEFGIEERNPERKLMQMAKMKRWRDLGGVEDYFIFSFTDIQYFFKIFDAIR